MATAYRQLPTDAPTDQLPDDLPEVPPAWRRITDRDDLFCDDRTAWVHEETELRVGVRSDARPTQMHTPETAKRDTGFVAYVRGDVGGQLTYDLAAKNRAYEAAIRFMAAYPDGQFDVPDPRTNRPRDHGPIDWRTDDE